MTLLTVLVAVFIALTLLNLLLTTSVIRRLGNQERLRAEMRPRLGGPEVGERAPAVPGTSDGDTTLVALLSTDCKPCDRAVPQLAAAAPRLALRGIDVLAVIGLGDASPDDMLAGLGVNVRTITEAAGHGPVHQSFSPGATPAFYLVEKGVVSTKSVDLAECLPAEFAAAR